jgi:hypothetical protein
MRVRRKTKKTRIVKFGVFHTSLTLILCMLSVIPVQNVSAQYTGYLSYFYTFDEAILFSYSNNTYFIVRNSAGGTVWNGTLDSGSHMRLTPGEGIYSVKASQPYTILVGAAQTQNVVGYYTIDVNGKGTSKDIYTYIPPPNHLYAKSKFTIFAYSNNTDVKITDASTKATLWQGKLNQSQHFSQDLSNATWQNKYVHIQSTYQVSALCYLDQGFIVPSSTGLFTGTTFYTFVSNITNGNNELNVIGYNNDAWVTISNTESQVLIWNGTLNQGETHSEAFAKQTYLTVTSNRNIAVTVDPYQTWPLMYQAALYAANSNGTLIGKQFFTTARGGGYLYIFAYHDSTHVTVTNQATHSLIWNGTLNEMQFYTKTVSHSTYSVTSDKEVAVLEGYGEWSAMFSPLYYTAEKEPPTITHVPVLTGNENQAITISATITDSTRAVTEAKLYYKKTDEAVYTSIAMTKSDNTYTGIIPSSSVTTAGVQYYINATDGINFSTHPAINPTTFPHTITISAENQPPMAVTLNPPTSITDKSMKLSWTKNNDADFAEYEIYKSTSSGTLGTKLHSISDRSTISYVVTQLSPNTTYYFSVRVTDAAGLFSDSNQVNGKTLTTEEAQDKTPPTIQVTRDPLTPTTNQTITFTLVVTDNTGGSGVANATLYIDGIAAQTWTTAGTHFYTGGPYSEGTHTYYAQAFDNANNAAREPSSGNNEFTVSGQQSQLLPVDLWQILALALVAFAVIALIALMARRKNRAPRNTHTE